LREIGFKARYISACVANEEGVFGPEFDHMAIIVSLEDKEFLVDVGFGEFALFPLEIKKDEIQNDPRGSFRIVNYQENRLLVERLNGNKITARYHFSKEKREATEFLEMCTYHQTNPSSPFVKNRLCSIPTVNGRITVTGNKLCKTENGKVTQRTIADSKDLNNILREEFLMKNR
jgi:N-hydroxyarylamine O-acetyltransferase